MSQFNLIVLQEGRDCDRCSMPIKAGEKAVKSLGRVYDAGGYHDTTRYQHESCWIDSRKKR